MLKLSKIVFRKFKIASCKSMTTIYLGVKKLLKYVCYTFLSQQVFTGEKLKHQLFIVINYAITIKFGIKCNDQMTENGFLLAVNFIFQKVSISPLPTSSFQLPGAIPEPFSSPKTCLLIAELV